MRRGCLAMVVLLTWVAGAAAQDRLHATSRAFLQQHCSRCHAASESEGDFRLDTLSRDFSNPQVAQKWSEVVFRINAGEMPPEDEPQPTAKEIGQVVDALTKRIRQAAALRMAKRGHVDHYRLSRQEYAHTVYDLLGVVFDVEAPGAFSEDPRWQGFDRIGALLSTAPTHIDRYFQAADTVTALAYPDTPQPLQTVRKAPTEGKRQLLQLGESWYAFELKSPGRYRVKIRVQGLPAFTGRAPRLALWHNQRKKTFGGMELATAPDRAETVTLTGLFPAGGYAVRNHARSQNHPNGAYKLFRNEEVDADVPLAELQGGFLTTRTKIVDEQGRPVMPLLLIDGVEVEGPLVLDDVLRRREKYFPPPGASQQTLQECLVRFAEQAWRRPVTESEVERFVNFVAAEQEAGESYRDAYRSALASILVARSFLHLEMGTAAEFRVELTDFELASRLSYFLWSSMPDAELFAAARRGALRTRAGLEQQLSRMLDDPKIDRFLNSFPRQWLQLHRVGMFQPDPNLYPEYDPWLEESMVLETVGYFAEMFRKNLPLREAIDADWTMLNARLALHYGWEQPAGAELTRVKLAPETRRGGILTQAAILSLTSDGTRHRPVHRGAWLSAAILAHTPPSPPPNVDPLEPVARDAKKTTIREQLSAHATSPNCVSCHAKIDPLGLAFENFDAIGRWRDRERVRGGRGPDPVVDASGTLPDGRTFADVSEFKKHLASDPRLAEAFLSQLATYALRRVMTLDDAEALRRVAKAAGPEHRLRDLIRRLVLSDLFGRR